MISFRTLIYIMDQWPLAFYFTVPFIVIFILLRLLDIKIKKKEIFLRFDDSSDEIKAKFSSLLFGLSYKDWLYIFLILINSYFVVSLRYIDYNVPMGSDVTQYIYYLRKIDENPLNPSLINLFTVPKILFPFILYIMWKISFLDILAFFYYLPYLLVSLFSLSFYYLVVSVSPNKRELALLISLLTPTFFGYLRLTYDLYSNLLGLILFNLSLSEFLKRIRGENLSKLFFISTILLVFIHQFTAIFLFALIVYLLITLLITNKEEAISIIKEKYSLAFFLSLALSAILTFMFTSYVYFNYMYSKLWFHMVFNLGRSDTPTFAMLSVIALGYIIVKVNSDLERIPVLEYLTISWIGIVLLANLVGIGGLAWRYWILIPLPMLVGLFLYDLYDISIRIIKYLSNNTKVLLTYLKNQKLKKYLSITGKLSIILLIATPVFIHYQQFYENVKGLKMGNIPENVFINFKLIRDKYGYSNSSIKVYINTEGIIYHRWALAIIGDVIVAGGNLDEYTKSLYGRPGWWPRLRTTILVENITELLSLFPNVTIIVPSTLLDQYYDFEKEIITNDGVYEESINSYVIYQ